MVAWRNLRYHAGCRRMGQANQERHQAMQPLPDNNEHDTYTARVVAGIERHRDVRRHAVRRHNQVRLAQEQEP